MCQSRRELTEGCKWVLRPSTPSISSSGTVCTFLLNPRQSKKANIAVTLLKSANFAPSQEKGILLRNLATIWRSRSCQGSQIPTSLEKMSKCFKSRSYLIKNRARQEWAKLLVLLNVKAWPSHVQRTSGPAEIVLWDTRGRYQSEIPAKIWVKVLSLMHHLVLTRRLLKWLRLIASLGSHQPHSFLCAQLFS